MTDKIFWQLAPVWRPLILYCPQGIGARTAHVQELWSCCSIQWAHQSTCSLHVDGSTVNGMLQCLFQVNTGNFPALYFEMLSDAS